EEQCFTDSQKERGHHVAGPMRTQVNPRITNRRGDKPVEPAPAPVKQGKVCGSNGVVYNVSRRERSSRAGTIRGIGKLNDRFLEEGKELRTRFLQLHHAHTLDLFWPVTRDG